jgi:hypothetical protein
VIPQEQWADLDASMRSQWDVFPVAGGYMRRLNGAPIVYTNAELLRIPHGEKPIVLIEKSSQSLYPADLLRTWTDPSAADAVIAQEGL